MLVMHVAESSGWAGGEAYLLKLATTLDCRRFRLAVVVPERGPLVTRLDALGVPTWQVPLTHRLLSVRALRGLIALFRRERPALVQSHGARSNVYTKLAGWFARVPVIVATVHNSLFDYEISALRRRLYVWAEVATGPLADRGDASPLKLFDYLACGRPVVASAIPLLRDLLSRAEGIAPVPPEHPEALAKEIIRLLEDQETARPLGEKGRQWVLEAHSWDAAAKRLLRVCEEILQKRRR